MNYKVGNNRAFTLIELLVAVGILVIILSFASVIFKVSIEAHRTAIANAEIMQKLRAITDQLNADFKGLRKDGEIFLVWDAKRKSGADPVVPNSYERFDRIMFFADGDFQSYKTNPMVRGNIARICYMLAQKGDVEAQDQEKTERILARTQHILTADPDPLLKEFILDPNFGGTELEWNEWNNILEYDKVTLDGWKNIRIDLDSNDPRGRYQPCKMNMLSVIVDVDLTDDRTGISVDDSLLIGATVEPSQVNSIHKLLCEGVGEFKIQGWYDAQQRWVPEVDPDGDGGLSDTDFILDTDDPTILDPNDVPTLLYPYRIVTLEPPELSQAYSWVNLGGVFSGNLYLELLNESSFNLIPGLGRALKFTFTLYDSKGIIKRGRTFTHIVYLDN
jgi:prepilin-type N-terminal cleavage/methylation domain-containing protein